MNSPVRLDAVSPGESVVTRSPDGHAYRSGYLVGSCVGLAFAIEVFLRLLGSHMLPVVSNVISMVAILFLMVPALYLVTKTEAGSALRWSVIAAVFFVMACQLTYVCAEIPFCDSWPLLSHDSEWRTRTRSVCALIGLVMLLGTFYFSLLATLRAKAALAWQSEALAREATERRHAEERYRTEYVFRESVIQNSAEGLCVCHRVDDPTLLRFTVWNRRMIDITGYTMEEINLQGWQVCMPTATDLGERLAIRIERMQRGEHLEQAEWPIVGKDGGRRTVSISTSVLQEFESQLHILVVVTDITAHKIADRKLEREAALRRALFEKSFDGIVVLTLDGAVFEANEAMCQLLGYAWDELKELRVWDWDGRWTAEAAIKNLRRLSVGSATIESSSRRKDGARIDVEVSVNGVRYGDQTLLYCVYRDVSSRKAADAALWESERRYRRIVDTATEGIWAINTDLITNFVNARMAEMLGYSVNDILGQPVQKFLWPEDLPVFHQQVAERSHGRSGHYELRWMHRNGEAVWTIVSATPLTGPNGNITGSFAMLTDITSRKRAEDALRESEEFYRQLFENNTAIKLLVEPSTGAIVDANPAAVEFYGYTREHLRQMSVGDINPLSSDEVFSQIRDAFDGSRFHFNFKHKLASGEFRDVEVYSGPVDVKGRHLLSSIVHDVTDRKRVETELEHIYTHARCILWHADVEVRDGDEFWRVRVPNLESAQRFLPLDLKPGQEYFDALWESRMTFPDHFLSSENPASHALRSGLPSFHQEFPCRDRNGEIRWLYEDAQIQTVGPQRWLVIGVSTDITDRKKAEEERSKLESQLLHAQKLEGIGVLAGGVAHDFNNILAGILGHAELARFDIDPASPAYASLVAIESSTQRAADLTRQMLAYSGKGKFLLQTVAISDEVRDMLALLTASISKKCALECRFEEALPSIEADAPQIRQMIMNLVVNAAESIGDRDGTITVSAFSKMCDRAFLSECYVDDSLPEGRYVALEVHDTGSGIEPVLFTKLFDPFFTTKFTGRGLGLSAVMGIVRSHHGTIRVQSEVGKGATFTVLFPALRVEPAPPAAPISVTAPRSAERTILVVDDEDAVRSVATLALERSGYRVLTAADGREGVDVFRRHADEVSLVLLDMTMPQMDGSEVFREIRKMDCHVRVILSSGFSEEDTRVRFEHEGLAGFIQKPYRVSELLRTITDALTSQSI